MRTVPHQPAVLDRGGLALFAVGQHDGVPAGPVRGPHGGQLHPERERGTAAALDTGRGDLGQQGLGITEGPVPAGGGVVGQ